MGCVIIAAEAISLWLEDDAVGDGDLDEGIGGLVIY